MKSSRRLGPCLTDLMSVALSSSGLLRTAPFWFLPGAHTLLRFLVKKKKIPLLAHPLGFFLCLALHLAGHGLLLCCLISAELPGGKCGLLGYFFYVLRPLGLPQCQC